MGFFREQKAWRAYIKQKNALRALGPAGEDSTLAELILYVDYGPEIGEKVCNKYRRRYRPDLPPVNLKDLETREKKEQA
ncbi:MAG: hypothetical protein ACYC5A_02625 [Thermoleophilia bacterium]